MESENYDLIKMIKVIFVETRSVNCEILEKIVDDAKRATKEEIVINYTELIREIPSLAIKSWETVLSVLIENVNIWLPLPKHIESEKEKEDFNKKACVNIKSIEVPKHLDRRLKNLLPNNWINGYQTQAFPPGSATPSKNKNMNEEYRVTWLAAYALAMQNSMKKQ